MSDVARLRERLVVAERERDEWKAKARRADIDRQRSDEAFTTLVVRHARLAEALRDLSAAVKDDFHPTQSRGSRTRKSLDAALAVLAECAGTPNAQAWRHSDGTVRVDHMDARPGDYLIEAGRAAAHEASNSYLASPLGDTGQSGVAYFRVVAEAVLDAAFDARLIVDADELAAGSRRAEAIALYFHQVNADMDRTGEHTFIPPTAISWLADGAIKAAREANDRR